MEPPAFLTRHKYGEIRLAGHRIGLFHVVWHYKQGDSPEKILRHFPTLSLDLIRQVLAFYHENQAEVDAYVAECLAEIERQHAEPQRGPDFAELQRRFEAMQRSDTR